MKFVYCNEGGSVLNQNLTQNEKLSLAIELLKDVYWDYQVPPMLAPMLAIALEVDDKERVEIIKQHIMSL